MAVVAELHLLTLPITLLHKKRLPVLATFQYYKKPNYCLVNLRVAATSPREFIRRKK